MVFVDLIFLLIWHYAFHECLLIIPVPLNGPGLLFAARRRAGSVSNVPFNGRPWWVKVWLYILVDTCLLSLSILFTSKALICSTDNHCLLCFLCSFIIYQNLLVNISLRLFNHSEDLKPVFNHPERSMRDANSRTIQHALWSTLGSRQFVFITENVSF